MEDSNIHIRCCDALEGLRQLEDNTLDCTVTSPPYNLGRKKRLQSQKEGSHTYTWAYDVFTDNMKEEDYQLNQREVLTTLYEKTKPRGSCFYIVRVRYVQGDALHPITWITQTPWCLREEIIWNKRSTPENYGHRFAQVDERIYWLTKGNHFFRKQIKNPLRLSSVWDIVNKKDTSHPATFTLTIPQICIDAVLPEEPEQTPLICDPYCGSGTTAVAAASRNYHFIGFDLSQKYVEMSIGRVHSFWTK